MDNLSAAGFDAVLLAETQNWKPGMGMNFNMTKEQVVNIPNVMTSFSFGLGWDTRCDIDASIFLMDRAGQVLETVYYGHLTSRTGAVRHSGDNLTGEGDGDDEVIHVDLTRLEHNVESIWPVITVYTNRMTFSDVKGAYCRIYAPDGSEFARYKLSDLSDNISNGCLVGSLHRNSGHWSLKALGYYTKNTQTPS